jgi:hypothetical protein
VRTRCRFTKSAQNFLTCFTYRVRSLAVMAHSTERGSPRSGPGGPRSNL